MPEPKVIYEDADIIVVDKPAGMSVHADGKNTDPTLIDWLLSKFPEIRDVGEPQKLGGGAEAPRPGIVHRIDRETSGVLVVARNLTTYERMKKKFARREVQKTYRTFVYGAVLDDRGIIDKPIGRARGSSSRHSVKDMHGTMREAQTAFRTIGRSSGKGDEVTSYLEVFPKTGRTHQIRVHLASIHHAVVCDRVYSPKQESRLGFHRLALHALSLSFMHPSTGKKVLFEAPLPPDFVEAERQLRQV